MYFILELPDLLQRYHTPHAIIIEQKLHENEPLFVYTNCAFPPSCTFWHRGWLEEPREFDHPTLLYSPDVQWGGIRLAYHSYRTHILIDKISPNHPSPYL